MESPVELKAIIEEVVQIAASYSVDVLGAVVTMVVGWTLAGWARRGVLRATSRLTWMDQTLRPLLASLARYGVLVITLSRSSTNLGLRRPASSRCLAPPAWPSAWRCKAPSAMWRLG